MEKNFSATDMLEFYDFLERNKIYIWIDGGWGVDALLGTQTRAHQDLDIVIQKKDLIFFLRLCKLKKYQETPRDDSCAWNFVMTDDLGRELDIHVIEIDALGNGIYCPVERNVYYPEKSLQGIGFINGIKLRCLTAEYQVESHTGYTLKEKDFKDVLALCEKFNINLPEEYFLYLKDK